MRIRIRLTARPAIVIMLCEADLPPDFVRVTDDGGVRVTDTGATRVIEGGRLVDDIGRIHLSDDDKQQTTD